MSQDLVSESDRVKGYCCQRGWVTRLLHMLHNQLLDSEVVLRELFILMEALGSFSLSSKELKQLLRFLYGQTTSNFAEPSQQAILYDPPEEAMHDFYPSIQVPTGYLDVQANPSLSLKDLLTPLRCLVRCGVPWWTHCSVLSRNKSVDGPPASGTLMEEK